MGDIDLKHGAIVIHMMKLLNCHCLCTFQIAAGLFSVHVMEKLVSGDAGNLCVFIIEKLNILTKKVWSCLLYSLKFIGIIYL